VSFGSGLTEKYSTAVATDKSISYTESELRTLYEKYGITENDLKFANDTLPYYLEGTILDSELRIIASKTGKPPKDSKEGKDYDLVISHKEMFDIIDEARSQYFKKYGVDPADPKIDIVNGYALPKSEVKKLVESRKVTMEPAVSEEEMHSFSDDLDNVPLFSTLSVGTNPYAINGIINEYIFVAKDTRHKPTQAITTDTHDALYRFEDFGIGVNVYWYWNYWDASDVSPANSASMAIADLYEDTAWRRSYANDMVIGWTHNMDKNGIAYGSWAFALCADTADGADWPHDSIVQHEVSHNFDAADQNSALHPACIMKYVSAYSGIDVWCTSCGITVNNGIYN
jgi:hypothetical protein